MSFVVKLNDAVARTPIGKWFALDGSGAKKERAGSRFTVCVTPLSQLLKTLTFCKVEIRAGLTTWVGTVI